MRKFCPGFTLIELLVTISIAAILFGIGVAQYNQFNRQQIFSQAVLNLKNNLRLAQNNALTVKKDCLGTLDGYEVAFSPTSYSFRAKCGVNYGGSTTINLPSSITITTFPSPNPILFKVLSQGTNIPGSTNIVLSGFGRIQTITVTSVGEIR
jgi:prepilin-type N-terminal cleavage/methylation domain-containing protein